MRTVAFEGVVHFSQPSRDILPLPQLRLRLLQSAAIDTLDRLQYTVISTSC